jgi:hypothetical protein
LTTTTDHVPVPDCTAALHEWGNAYRKRNADGVFLHWLKALEREFIALLAAAPTRGEPLTFSPLGRMPQPTQDFYAELIDASASLAELIADHDPMRTAYRHAALVLISDALGAEQNVNGRDHERYAVMSPLAPDLVTARDKATETCAARAAVRAG